MPWQKSAPRQPQLSATRAEPHFSEPSTRKRAMLGQEAPRRCAQQSVFASVLGTAPALLLWELGLVVPGGAGGAEMCPRSAGCAESRSAAGCAAASCHGGDLKKEPGWLPRVLPGNLGGICPKWEWWGCPTGLSMGHLRSLPRHSERTGGVLHLGSASCPASRGSPSTSSCLGCSPVHRWDALLGVVHGKAR